VERKGVKKKDSSGHSRLLRIFTNSGQGGREADFCFEKQRGTGGMGTKTNELDSCSFRGREVWMMYLPGDSFRGMRRRVVDRKEKTKGSVPAYSDGPD